MAWPEQYKSLWWRDSEASSREAHPVNLQLTTATSRRIPACSESQSRRHSQCRPQLKRMGLYQFGGYLKGRRPCVSVRRSPRETSHRDLNLSSLGSRPPDDHKWCNRDRRCPRPGRCHTRPCGSGSRKHPLALAGGIMNSPPTSAPKRCRPMP